MSLARKESGDEDRYQNIYLQAVDAILLVDLKTKKILKANRLASELTGYTRSELEGMLAYDLRPADERQRLEFIFQELERVGEVRNVEDTHIRRKDRRIIPIELSSKVIPGERTEIVMSVLRDISARKEVEEELAGRNEDLEILNKTAIEVASGLDLNKILKKLLEHAVELAGADAGVVAIVNNETGTISRPYVLGLPTDIFQDTQQNVGLTGEVIFNKQPVFIEDYENSPEPIRDLVDAGVHEIAAIPLTSKGVAFGALIVFMLSKKRHFSERNLHLLEGVGRLGGVALENAQLFAVERRERVTLSAMEAISRSALTVLDVDALLLDIVKAIVGIMNTCCGAIYLIKEGWLTVRASSGPGAPKIGARVRFGEGLVGRVASTGRALAISDLKTYPQLSEEVPTVKTASAIAVPLEARGRIIGVARFDTMDKHVFDADETHFFGALADRAAVAVDNAKLFRSEKRRAQETSALMHLTSDLLSILDTKEFLRHVVERAVELIDAEMGFAPIVVNGTTLDLREYFAINQGWRPTDMTWPVGHDIPGYVLETEEIIVVDDAERSALADPEIARKMKLRNLIAAPVITRTREFIAVIVTANKRDGVFTGRDSELLKAIVGQAAIGIENVRLYEYQRHIAQTLQKSLLPEKLPEIPNTDLGVSYTSATFSATAGGDFYDVIELPNGRIGFLIGDVSGKGIEAATTSALTRFVVKMLAFENPDPASVLEKVNDALYRQTKAEEFVSMFFGVFDPRTGQLIYANAGHPPPFTCGPIACTATEENQEMISGAFESAPHTNSVIEFVPGSGLVLYTDGLIEARRGGEFFGERRLKRIITAHGNISAQQLAEKLFDEVKRFSGGRLLDDVAIVVIKRS